MQSQSVAATSAYPPFDTLASNPTKEINHSNAQILPVQRKFVVIRKQQETLLVMRQKTKGGQTTETWEWGFKSIYIKTGKQDIIEIRLFLGLQITSGGTYTDTVRDPCHSGKLLQDGW